MAVTRLVSFIQVAGDPGGVAEDEHHHDAQQQHRHRHIAPVSGRGGADNLGPGDRRKMCSSGLEKNSSFHTQL